jgi:hypothetical protein
MLSLVVQFFKLHHRHALVSLTLPGGHHCLRVIQG